MFSWNSRLPASEFEENIEEIYTDNSFFISVWILLLEMKIIDKECLTPWD